MNLKPGRELREFNQICKELDDIYHETAVKMGISDGAYMVFYMMAEFGDGCLQKDVADFFSVSKQTIHSVVKRLEEDGYLYAKQGHGREKKLFLTERGKEFSERHIEPIIALENSIFADMTGEESRKLLELARKFVSLYREKVRKL